MAAVSHASDRCDGHASPTPDRTVVDALITRLSVALGLAELLLEEPHLSVQARLDLACLADELVRAGELVRQIQPGTRPPPSPAEAP